MSTPAGAVFGQANASSDAGNYNAIDFQIQARLAKVQTLSIAEVISCTSSGANAPAGTVTIKVLVNLMTGNGQPVQHGEIYSLPYLRAQGGTSGIILDPVAGDIGLVGFCSRDSSAVVAAKGQANPGSARTFDWADGIYLGAMLNSALTQFIQFNSSGINITSPTAISLTSPDNTVNGPLTVTGATTLESTLLVALAATFTTSIESPVGSIAALEVTSISPISGSTIGFPTASIADTALVPTGVTAGSYTSTNLTVNAQGLITAAANGSGSGGGGTVTSVGISTPGTGVVVGGGPIVTAGTLTVDLSTVAYAALVLAVTSVQSVGAGSADIVIGGSSTAPTVDLSATVKTDIALAVSSVQSVGAGSADIVIGGSATAPTVDLSSTIKTDIALATTAIQAPASPAQGDVLYYNGSGWVLLAPGTSGYFLETQGAGANPQWAAVSSAPTTLSAAILADSPFVFWKCDDASGSFADSSGNSYNLTSITGAPTYSVTPLVPTTPTDLFTNIGGFSNTAASIGAGLASAFGRTLPFTTWTLECIIAPFYTASSATRLIDWACSATTAIIRLYIASSLLQIDVNNTAISAASQFTFTPGKAYHIMMTCSTTGTTSTFKTYVNGILVGSTTGTASTTTGASPIGGIGDSGTYAGSTGPLSVGYFAIYPTVLSVSRIAAHASAAGLLGV